MPQNLSKLQPVCACSSYAFPHRIGSGRCSAEWYSKRVWQGDRYSDPVATTHDICSGCGQPSDTKEMDFGIGSYEYWGAPGVNVNWQTVSDCCEEPMVPNTWSERSKHNWEIVK